MSQKKVEEVLKVSLKIYFMGQNILYFNSLHSVLWLTVKINSYGTQWKTFSVLKRVCYIYFFFFPQKYVNFKILEYFRHIYCRVVQPAFMLQMHLLNQYFITAKLLSTVI